jgi:hypothetical protein
MYVSLFLLPNIAIIQSSATQYGVSSIERYSYDHYKEPTTNPFCSSCDWYILPNSNTLQTINFSEYFVIDFLFVGYFAFNNNEYVSLRIDANNTILVRLKKLFHMLFIIQNIIKAIFFAVILMKLLNLLFICW